jgi:hypothetical protein
MKPLNEGVRAAGIGRDKGQHKGRRKMRACGLQTVHGRVLIRASSDFWKIIFKVDLNKVLFL